MSYMVKTCQLQFVSFIFVYLLIKLCIDALHLLCILKFDKDNYFN